METKTFNVKEKSVHAFMRENMTNPIMADRDGRYDHNPHYLMQNEILFKVDCGIKIGEKVCLQLEDQSKGSSKPLTNHYTYEAKQYDDVSIKMELVDFKITFDETPSK